LVKILSVLTVIAAAEMVFAGCDIPVRSGGDESASPEITAPESGGGPTAFSASALKKIRVKFEVLNGGYGLAETHGFVSTQDNTRIRWCSGEYAGDFDIEIIVPAGEKYLNIGWRGTDFFWKYTYLKGGIKLEDGKGTYPLVFDYNGLGKVAAKRLTDVFYVSTKDVNNNWKNASKIAANTDPDGFRRITVKFDVRNGGWGLSKSEGIVSTQDDICYLEYDHDICANDFTITLPVPVGDEYLNVRWRGDDFILSDDTYVKAKMKAEDGTITIDYNGYGWVETKNLYDVQVAGDFDIYNNQSVIAADWEAAKNRSN